MNSSAFGAVWIWDVSCFAILIFFIFYFNFILFCISFPFFSLVLFDFILYFFSFLFFNFV